MDFSQIWPLEEHPHLVWLGKLSPWVSVEKQEGCRSNFRVDRQKIRSAPGYREHSSFVERILSLREALYLSWVEAFSVSLAQGPKVFLPTHEQFESMQHVEIHIPISEYRQPYPSLFVQIPSESRKSLAREVGVPPEQAPQYILLRAMPTLDGGVFIFIGQSFPGSGEDNSCTFQSREEFPDMEAALQRNMLRPGLEDIDSRFGKFTERSGRAALNLMLLLTHYGHRDGGPLHPQDYEKHRRKRSLERFCHGDFTTVELSQEVIVRREESPRVGEGEPTGKEVSPHWRRGHWRNQRCGTGLQQVKRIFISPVFIRADRAVGDLSSTSASYKTGKA